MGSSFAARGVLVALFCAVLFDDFVGAQNSTEKIPDTGKVSSNGTQVQDCGVCVTPSYYNCGCNSNVCCPYSYECGVNACDGSGVPAPSSGSGSNCFAADAKVAVPAGRRTLARVSLGDRILVRRASGDLAFASAYMITHKEADAIKVFMEVTLASGNTVTATADHVAMLVVNGASELRELSGVVIGDVFLVETVDRLLAESRVTSVREIRKRGLYNVHAAGDMLVDGVAMSSYNGRVSRALSKILLAVARVAYRVMGVRAFEAVNAAYLSLDGNAVLALASGPAGFSAGGTGAHRA